jgi:solute carrier family 25 phosphate transporter 3
MIKDVLFVLSKFVVFDIIKTALFLYFPDARDSLSSSLLISLVSGSLAGMVSAVTSQPGDYLFSKTSASVDASLGSAWSTYWRGAVDKGRWADILTGLSPRIVFSGALIAIQFVIYDLCRVQFHVSPNDLQQFLDVMGSFPSTAV